MKKRLTQIGPLKAGIVLGVLYGVLGLLVAPFMLLAAIFGKSLGTGAVIGVAFAILIPVFYAGIGFISGVIGAFVYNLVAKWTGGLEFELADMTTLGYTEPPVS